MHDTDAELACRRWGLILWGGITLSSYALEAGEGWMVFCILLLAGHVVTFTVDFWKAARVTPI